MLKNKDLSISSCECIMEFVGESMSSKPRCLIVFMSLLLLLCLLFSRVYSPKNMKKLRIFNPGECKVKLLRDLDYSNEGDRQRMLDLYLPVGVSFPKLVVFIHGGAFVSGDKMRGFPFCSFYASWGFACASVNYRLAPKYKWPTQIEDIKNAIKWLVKNSRKYGFDSDKIVVVGTSAGGHLASILGLTNTAGYNIAGVIDMFGPTYLDEKFIDENPDFMFQLFGLDYEKNKDIIESFIVLNYVDKYDPPFLIIHGENDELVPLKHSILLKEKLEEYGVDVKLIVVKNSGHGLKPADKSKGMQPNIAEIFKEKLNFIRRRLTSR